jgi:hypothetical protein
LAFDKELSSDCSINGLACNGRRYATRFD